MVNELSPKEQLQIYFKDFIPTFLYRESRLACLYTTIMFSS